MTDSRSRSSRVLRYGGAAGGLALIAMTGLACTRQPVAAATLPIAAANQPAALPIAVNCGPGQQALIRPGLVNGELISQVDCVTAPQAAAPLAMAPAPAPAAYPVAYQTAQSMASDIETMRVVERPVYRQAARPVAYRTAEYEPERRVVRSGRSWQKSALIIGSSAGIGAGVGGAVGGRKGELIGAAVGGGGATIWDQVTRRK